MTDLPESRIKLLARVAESHRYPLLFATLSGSHLYGFDSPDSDFDLRGSHVLPAREVVGLGEGMTTVQNEQMIEGLEIDLVTHDIKKFFEMLLKRNGYVLEQLYSPIVIQTSDTFEELKSIARGCITRHHNYHYLGFAETQWKLFTKDPTPMVKPLLYTYRVLLTGIHLLRTGEIEANLTRLAEEAKLSHVTELIEHKRQAKEKAVLTGADVGFHLREYERLRAELASAHAESTLPDISSARPALNDLLVRLRLKTVG